MFPLTKWR